MAVFTQNNYVGTTDTIFRKACYLYDEEDINGNNTFGTSEYVTGSAGIDAVSLNNSSMIRARARALSKRRTADLISDPMCRTYQRMLEWNREWE